MRSLIPIKSSSYNERFYDEVIKAFDFDDTLDSPTIKSIPPTQHYNCSVNPNSIGYVSLAMFDNGSESRWSSALLLDTRLPNLKVVTDFTVDRVIFDKDRVAKSVISAKGNYINLNDKPTSSIILTAGSIGTPAILQRSGIGPKWLSTELGIENIVVNEEVGHGVDHMEVPVLYGWNDKWNEPDGHLPKGGPMAWPLVIFFGNDEVMAHFGISPPPYGGKEITITPNCMRPNPDAGFRVCITSKDPTVPAKLVHASADEYEQDFQTLARGIKTTVKTFDPLQGNLFGPRIAPSDDVLKDDKKLMEYVKNHLGTAYHWMSTCKAGAAGSVADEKFRVRGVERLRVGSGACLPEIPVANPHLTISAMSIAMAKTIRQDNIEYYERKSRPPICP
jgi:choline dehydrogenase